MQNRRTAADIARANAMREAEEQGTEFVEEKPLVEDLDTMPAVVPEISDEQAAEPIAEDEEGRRDQIVRLYGVDREIVDQLSLAEIDEIIAAERKRADEEKKKAATAAFRALALQRERIDAGLIPGDVMRDEAETKRLNEKIKIRISLPGSGAGHREHGLRVDQRLFRHGQTYTVTRAEGASLLSMMYQALFQELRFRTNDQDKPGNSAVDMMQQLNPRFIMEDHGSVH